MAAGNLVALRARFLRPGYEGNRGSRPPQDTVRGVTDQGVSVLPYTFSVTNIELSRLYSGCRIRLIRTHCSISWQYGRFPVEIRLDPPGCGYVYILRWESCIPSSDTESRRDNRPTSPQHLPGSESARLSVTEYLSA